MLKAGQVIESPRGTRIEILENTPKRISFQRTLPPLTGGTKSKEHRHTETSETYELLAGEATAWIAGKEHKLTAGTVLEIPLGSPHVNPYTGAGQDATLVQTVAPRSRGVEVYFTSWMNWLGEGKADAHDEPTILQLAAIIKEGGRAGTWPTKPPVIVQQIGLPILGIIAGLKGIRAERVPRERPAAISS
ncbi:MAG TPA: cupin domain-containing protein [Solirubrobacteraceae bacterium]|jgi:mannose-6-phosphate isomerase-like protein (cupin superfamily)